MKYTSISLAMGGLCLVSAGAVAGSPQYVDNCFESLEPGGHYVLRENLTCGCEDPAITLTGPAKLNLKGKTISCSACEAPGEPGTGILVQGNKAVVVNGTVSHCDNGVEVDEGNHHRFVKLTLSENLGDGLRIKEGQHHRFVNLTLSENDSNGLRADDDGSHSLFTNIRAYGNGNRGVRVDGQHNKLIYNQAWGNGSQGVRIRGDHNKLAFNTANRNCRDGIEIQGGDKNVLVNNIASGNGNPDACPDVEPEDMVNYPLGIDYRPWFYAGFDITKADDKRNLILLNKAEYNLGCWVPPGDLVNPELNDVHFWNTCIGFLPPDKLTAVKALRNRNLWDENATDSSPYMCESKNKWIGNRSDREYNAEPECPCVDGLEGCDLAP